MPSIVYDAAPSGRIVFRNPLQYGCETMFKAGMEKSGPTLTLLRLCTSRHVNDLQWIAVVSWLVVAVDLISFILVLRHNGNNTATYSTICTSVAGAAALALNWTYQTGSSRLGAIDLFASEMAVICRVSLIIDFAKQSLAGARGIATHADDGGVTLDTLSKRRKFTSEEHYTPVYDSSFSDLKPLDVDIVSYVTQFYTYRKTMVDYMRLIASAESEEEGQKLYVYMVYMQYLMYENARYAAQSMIEFEPIRSEVIINILCSEIILFEFLLGHFKNDFRAKRLALRMEEYETDVPRIIARVKGMKGRNWEKAAAIVPELERRFGDAQAAIAKRRDRP